MQAECDSYSLIRNQKHNIKAEFYDKASKKLAGVLNLGGYSGNDFAYATA